MDRGTVRPARPAEAATLSELAFRSKAYWGYDDDFMEACRAELTVRRDQIDAGQVLVAVVDDVVVGFATLIGEPPAGELDAMFLDPQHIGTGVGGVLFGAVRDAARAAGFTRLEIEADPHAVGFYEHHGAVLVGDQPSASIPGRRLPVLDLVL